MNKKKIENLIPIAMEAIECQRIELLNDKKEIPKEFKGYISNFGASIIQSGLLATVAFYESKDSGAKEDRSQLTRCILYLIDEDEKSKILKGEKRKLLKYILAYQKDNEELKEEIINAAISLKLALRTFAFTKE
jgi:CRISPR-associated protein Cmr5